MNDGYKSNGASTSKPGLALSTPGSAGNHRHRVQHTPGWTDFKIPRRQPWRILVGSLAGLVVAIAIAGFVGLALNQSVHDTTRGALAEDIELQDDADDLRVAILDVRHHHRNLAFYGPTHDRLLEFQTAYSLVLDEIAELEAHSVPGPSLPQPAQLLDAMISYNGEFLPALDLYESDFDAFEEASFQGLTELNALEEMARQIDRYAETEADLAVDRIEQASSNARLFLLIVIGGLVIISAVLIYMSIRVIREIDHLYAAEQAASQKLGQALMAKNNFIADASHELRTPITVLRGNAEVGLAIESNCGHREILEEIVEESVTMTRLVEDLLFLARFDASAPPLETEPVPIEKLMAVVAEHAEVLVNQRGGELVTNLTAVGVVNVDSRRVEQAVLALVDNAAKFGFAGGRVKLSSEIDGERLIVDVVDQGPGIPEAELPRIFERFYLVDRSRKKRKGGAGLGLSIAATIVEAHEGTIEATSQIGRGTSMRIRIPILSGVMPQSSNKDQVHA